MVFHFGAGPRTMPGLAAIETNQRKKHSRGYMLSIASGRRRLIVDNDN